MSNVKFKQVEIQCAIENNSIYALRATFTTTTKDKSFFNVDDVYEIPVLSSHDIEKTAKSFSENVAHILESSFDFNAKFVFVYRDKRESLENISAQNIINCVNKSKFMLDIEIVNDLIDSHRIAKNMSSKRESNSFIKTCINNLESDFIERNKLDLCVTRFKNAKTNQKLLESLIDLAQVFAINNINNNYYRLILIRDNRETNNISMIDEIRI